MIQRCRSVTSCQASSMKNSLSAMPALLQQNITLRQSRKRRNITFWSKSKATATVDCLGAFWVLASILLVVVLPQIAGANVGCRMELWVFDTLDRCEGGQTPNAKGFIYADGKCRTVEVTSPSSGSISDSDYNLLPGTYSAVCTNDGKKIRFEESGCTDKQCSSQIVGGDVCERDFSIEAALFSRLDPPEYKVQDPDNASQQGFFSCTRLIGTGITVTFTVFGDCSLCDPSSSGSDDDNDDGTSAIPVAAPPSPRPTRVPTPRPVAPPTDRPVPDPTSEPSPDPTPNPVPDVVRTSRPTRDPTPKPTRDPVAEPTLEPTPDPTHKPIPDPTRRPTRDPTSRPKTQDPSMSPITPGNPTTSPSISFKPTEPSPTTVVLTEGPTGPLYVDVVRVTMVLGEMNDLLSDEAASNWQNVTIEHIQQGAKSSQYVVGQITLVGYDDGGKIDQELLNTDGTPLSTSTIKTQHRRQGSTRFARETQEASERSSSYSIRLRFGVSVAIPESEPRSSPALSAGRIFFESFDTEADRTRYLFLLVGTGDSVFQDVRFVKVNPPSSSREPSSTLSLAPSSAVSTVGSLAPSIIDSSSSGSGGLIVPPTIKGPVAVASPAERNAQVPSTATNGLLGIVIGASVGLVAVLIAAALLIYTRMGRRGTGSNASDKGSGGSGTLEDHPPPSTAYHSSPLNPLFMQYNGHVGANGQRWTNEILVDPQLDDVSTLGGSILAGLHLVEGVGVEDEPTASVNVDYDFAKQQYRTSHHNNNGEERTLSEDVRSRSVSDKSNPTALSSSSGKMLVGRLGQEGNGTIVFADDMSFERQYDGATMMDDTDDHVLMHNHHNDLNDLNDPLHISQNTTRVGNATTRHPPVTATWATTANRSYPNNSMMMGTAAMGASSSAPPQTSTQRTLLRPFEIQVPPGLLGMVLDTPNGVPVVRAIKNNSVLNGQVCVGDRLLSVDGQDVTNSNMSVIEISSLISNKAHLHRTLVFLRPTPPAPASPPPSPPHSPPIR